MIEAVIIGITQKKYFPFCSIICQVLFRQLVESGLIEVSVVAHISFPPDKVVLSAQLKPVKSSSRTPRCGLLEKSARWMMPWYSRASAYVITRGNILLFRLFAFKGVEKIWPAGKGVGDLRKCKLSHQQKLSPQRELSYLFQPRPFQLLPTK